MQIDLGNIVGIAPPPAYLHVRTNSIGPQGGLTVDGPFPNGLTHQRQRRHQHQHRAAFSNHILCDLQAGEGLAGPASHDQLAPVCLCQPLPNRFQCVLLMGAQFLGRGNPDFVPLEIGGPINRASLQPVDINGRDVQIVQQSGGVAAPRRTCRFNDQPAREMLGLCAAQEAVDIALLDAIAFPVEFALDGAIAVLTPDLGNSVNPNIPAVESVGLGPITKQPTILIFLLHSRVVLDERNSKTLEIRSLLSLAL